MEASYALIEQSLNPEPYVIQFMILTDDIPYAVGQIEKMEK